VAPAGWVSSVIVVRAGWRCRPVHL